MSAKGSWMSFSWPPLHRASESSQYCARRLSRWRRWHDLSRQISRNGNDPDKAPEPKARGTSKLRTKLHTPTTFSTQSAQTGRLSASAATPKKLLRTAVGKYIFAQIRRGCAAIELKQSSDSGHDRPCKRLFWAIPDSQNSAIWN